MRDKLAANIATTPATVATAVVLLFGAFFSAPARAQAIRCENLVFTDERIACYYYRAARSPGPSCLFCAPKVQQPAKRVKKRRARR